MNYFAPYSINKSKNSPGNEILPKLYLTTGILSWEHINDQIHQGTEYRKSVFLNWTFVSFYLKSRENTHC